MPKEIKEMETKKNQWIDNKKKNPFLYELETGSLWADKAKMSQITGISADVFDKGIRGAGNFGNRPGVDPRQGIHQTRAEASNIYMRVPERIAYGVYRAASDIFQVIEDKKDEENTADKESELNKLELAVRKTFVASEIIPAGEVQSEQHVWTYMEQKSKQKQLKGLNRYHAVIETLKKLDTYDREQRENQDKWQTEKGFWASSSATAHYAALHDVYDMAEAADRCGRSEETASSAGSSSSSNQPPPPVGHRDVHATLTDEMSDNKGNLYLAFQAKRRRVLDKAESAAENSGRALREVEFHILLNDIFMVEAVSNPNEKYFKESGRTVQQVVYHVERGQEDASNEQKARELKAFYKYTEKLEDKSQEQQKLWLLKFLVEDTEYPADGKQFAKFVMCAGTSEKQSGSRRVVPAIRGQQLEVEYYYVDMWVACILNRDAVLKDSAKKDMGEVGDEMTRNQIIHQVIGKCLLGFAGGLPARETPFREAAGALLEEKGGEMVFNQKLADTSEELAKSLYDTYWSIATCIAPNISEPETARPEKATEDISSEEQFLAAVTRVSSQGKSRISQIKKHRWHRESHAQGVPGEEGFAELTKAQLGYWEEAVLAFGRTEEPDEVAQRLTVENVLELMVLRQPELRELTEKQKRLLLFALGRKELLEKKKGAAIQQAVELLRAKGGAAEEPAEEPDAADLKNAVMNLLIGMKGEMLNKELALDSVDFQINLDFLQIAADLIQRPEFLETDIPLQIKTRAQYLDQLEEKKTVKAQKGRRLTGKAEQAPQGQQDAPDTGKVSYYINYIAERTGLYDVEGQPAAGVADLTSFKNFVSSLYYLEIAAGEQQDQETAMENINVQTAVDSFQENFFKDFSSSSMREDGENHGKWAMLAKALSHRDALDLDLEISKKMLDKTAKHKDEGAHQQLLEEMRTFLTQEHEEEPEAAIYRKAACSLILRQVDSSVQQKYSARKVLGKDLGYQPSQALATSDAMYIGDWAQVRRAVFAMKEATADLWSRDSCPQLWERFRDNLGSSSVQPGIQAGGGQPMDLGERNFQQIFRPQQEKECLKALEKLNDSQRQLFIHLLQDDSLDYVNAGPAREGQRKGQGRIRSLTKDYVRGRMAVLSGDSVNRDVQSEQEQPAGVAALNPEDQSVRNNPYWKAALILFSGKVDSRKLAQLRLAEGDHKAHEYKEALTLCGELNVGLFYRALNQTVLAEELKEKENSATLVADVTYKFTNLDKEPPEQQPQANFESEYQLASDSQPQGQPQPEVPEILPTYGAHGGSAGFTKLNSVNLKHLATYIGIRNGETPDKANKRARAILSNFLQQLLSAEWTAEKLKGASSSEKEDVKQYQIIQRGLSSLPADAMPLVFSLLASREAVDLDKGKSRDQEGNITFRHEMDQEKNGELLSEYFSGELDSITLEQAEDALLNLFTRDMSQELLEKKLSSESVQQFDLDSLTGRNGRKQKSVDWRLLRRVLSLVKNRALYGADFRKQHDYYHTLLALRSAGSAETFHMWQQNTESALLANTERRTRHPSDPDYGAMGSVTFRLPADSSSIIHSQRRAQFVKSMVTEGIRDMEKKREEAAKASGTPYEPLGLDSPRNMHGQKIAADTVLSSADGLLSPDEGRALADEEVRKSRIELFVSDGSKPQIQRTKLDDLITSAEAICDAVNGTVEVFMKQDATPAAKALTSVAASLGILKNTVTMLYQATSRTAVITTDETTGEVEVSYENHGGIEYEESDLSSQTFSLAAGIFDNIKEALDIGEGWDQDSTSESAAKIAKLSLIGTSTLAENLTGVITAAQRMKYKMDSENKAAQETLDQELFTYEMGEEGLEVAGAVSGVINAAFSFIESIETFKQIRLTGASPVSSSAAGVMGMLEGIAGMGGAVAKMVKSSLFTEAYRTDSGQLAAKAAAWGKAVPWLQVAASGMAFGKSVAEAVSSTAERGGDADSMAVINAVQSGMNLLGQTGNAVILQMGAAARAGYGTPVMAMVGNVFEIAKLSTMISDTKKNKGMAAGVKEGLADRQKTADSVTSQLQLHSEKPLSAEEIQTITGLDQARFQQYLDQKNGAEGNALSQEQLAGVDEKFTVIEALTGKIEQWQTLQESDRKAEILRRVIKGDLRKRAVDAMNKRLQGAASIAKSVFTSKEIEQGWQIASQVLGFAVNLAASIPGGLTYGAAAVANFVTKLLTAGGAAVNKKIKTDIQRNAAIDEDVNLSRQYEMLRHEYKMTELPQYTGKSEKKKTVLMFMGLRDEKDYYRLMINRAAAELYMQAQYANNRGVTAKNALTMGTLRLLGTFDMGDIATVRVSDIVKALAQ